MNQLYQVPYLTKCHEDNSAMYDEYSEARRLKLNKNIAITAYLVDAQEEGALDKPMTDWEYSFCMDMQKTLEDRGFDATPKQQAIIDRLQMEHDVNYQLKLEKQMKDT